MPDFPDNGAFTDDNEEDEFDSRDVSSFRPFENVSERPSTGNRPTVSQVVPLGETSRNGDKSSCVLIGPPESGKTTLIAAIKRACNQLTDDGLEFKFNAEPETAELIKRQIRKLSNLAPGLEATYMLSTYGFQISVTGPAPSMFTGPREEDLNIILADAGGGSMLPPEDTVPTDRMPIRQEMLQRTRDAHIIIFCVDATEPNLGLLEKEMALLFALTTTPYDYTSPLHWKDRLRYFLKHWAWAPRRPRQQPCLQATRFLVLLTQVDKLCSGLPAGVTPANFAKMIDPLRQAGETLSHELLNSIRSVLKPDDPEVRFAVGLVSSMGFRPDSGTQFADGKGKPICIPGQESEYLMKTWTPFGIRDALYFIATGECRGSVSEVRYADLKSEKRPLPIFWPNKAR